MESDATTCESRDILSAPGVFCCCIGFRLSRLSWQGFRPSATFGEQASGLSRSAQWAWPVLCPRSAGGACTVTSPALLPLDGPRRIVVRSRHPASRREPLEPARPDNPDRHHRPVVSARDVLGKILERSLTISGKRYLRYPYGFKALPGSKRRVMRKKPLPFSLSLWI